MARRKPHVVAAALMAAVAPAAAWAEVQVVTYRQGLEGYAGQQDTVLYVNNPDAVRGGGGTEQLFTDWYSGVDPNQGVTQTLIRFDGLPVGVTVVYASLLLTTGGGDMPGYGARFYRMLQPWSAADTYNEWVGGVQPNGVEAPTTPSFEINGSVGQGTITLDVTTDVKAWAAGTANYGWVTNPFFGRDNAWGFFSGLTYGAGNRRPMLQVTYDIARRTQVWTDQSNDHQWNTTSTNFQTAGIASVFAAGDWAVFNDFAGPDSFTVHMNTPLAAGRVLVNTASQYTFTGTSAVTGMLGAALSKQGSGTLTLGNSVSHDFSGGVSVFQGTLQIDLNAMPTRKNQIAPSSALVMGNATLKVLGSSSGTSSQTFSALTISGGATRIELDNNGGPGTTLTFDATARINGGTLDVAPIPAGSVLNLSYTNIGGYATYNQTDWLDSTGGGVTPGPVGPFTAYVDDAWTPTGNTNVLASANFSVNSETRSLRFNAPTDITLTLASVSGTLTAGGILVTPNVGAHNILIAGGRINSNNAKDIIVHQYNPQGTITISSQLYPNPDNDVANQGLTITGTGEVAVVNPANSFPGQVTVNGTVLTVGSVANGGAMSSLGLSSNAASNLALNQGTLRYFGAQAATDRLFTLGQGGGAIEASGTGPLLFTQGSAISFAQTVHTTLTLAGTNTGTNLMTPYLIDPDSSHQYTLAVVKAGPGKWVLNGANTFTGGLTIQQGILEVGVGSTTGTPGAGPIVNNGTLSFNRSGTLVLGNAVSGTGGLTKTGSGTVTFNGAYSGRGAIALQAGKLVFGSNAETELKVPSLTVAANTTLDITSKVLVLQSDPLVGGDKAAKLALLRSNLLLGRNGGNWLGKGITSSTIAADQSATGSKMMALALYDNAVLGLSTLGNVNVDSNSLIVTTALLGDANFDGMVSETDFSIVSNYWQTSQIGWSKGDLNFDGFVDILDAVMVATNMGHQLNSPNLLSSAPAVPEPATFSVGAGILTILLLRRRQR